MELRQERLGGNTNTGVLKIIALVFMVSDHFGKMLFPGIMEFRLFGRLAFPIYAWCLVVGFHYTRSVPKYILRLLAVGLISQPIYMAALNHTWSDPNIFFTLTLGITALYGIRLKKFGSQVWVPAIALYLAQSLGVDYGWRGVTLIMLLYAARKDKGGLAAVMVAFCLYWGSTSSTLQSFMGIPLTGLYKTLPTISATIQPLLKLQSCALLSLPFILIQMPWEMKLPKWAGYALYPGHLILLWIIEKCLGM